jgi:hypothetical protein
VSVDEGSVDRDGQKGDWDVLVAGIYGVYRTQGDFYFKVKGGVIYRDYSVSVSNIAGASDTGGEFKASFGPGVGFRLGKNMGFEAEFIRIDTNINFLTANFRFSF